MAFRTTATDADRVYATPTHVPIDLVNAHISFAIPLNWTAREIENALSGVWSTILTAPGAVEADAINVRLQRSGSTATLVACGGFSTIINL